MPAPPMYYSMPANYYGWAPPAYNFPAPEGKEKIYPSEEGKEKIYPAEEGKEDLSKSNVSTVMRRFKKK